MEKIIFVCLGNICRSPMAEFVMKDLLEKSGRSGDFVIESRATSNWEHGNPTHAGTVKELAKHGIKVDKTKTSLRINTSDFKSADKIIAMDEANLSDLKKMAPKNCQEKIEMLLPVPVPDPWYTGEFGETYQLVKKGCEQLLRAKTEQ